MKKFTSLLLLLVGLGLSAMAFAAKELVDPAPVPVPAGMEQKELIKQIKKAFIGRGWAIEGEEPGQINATLYIRKHVAKVAATYDKEQVVIRYLDSENLSYKEKKGKPYIHKNYMSWVENVRSDLNRALQLEMLESAE